MNSQAKKSLHLLICAILSTGMLANITSVAAEEPVVQQADSNVSVKYALLNGKFYIKTTGLNFESVNDLLLNGEPITAKVLEWVTNKLADVSKEKDAFTISFTLPKESNFGGMTLGIVSGTQIYSSQIPSQVFGQESIQVFDSVVSVSSIDVKGTRSVNIGKLSSVNTDNNMIWSTPTALGVGDKNLYLQSYSSTANTGQNQPYNTIINSGNTGKVGVGTNTPRNKLEVADTVQVSNHKLSSSNLSEGLLFNYETGAGKGADIISTSGLFNFNKLAVNGSPITLNTTSHANVGVDIDNPTEKLDVNGRALIRGSDFMLGTNDGRNIGTKPLQRALVHIDGNAGTTKKEDTLVINFGGDFEGGVEVHSNLRVTGEIQGKLWYSNNYVWDQGYSPVRLMHSSRGFCFLTGVRGKFGGWGEYVSVYIGNDSYWYLGGASGQVAVHGEARCVGIPS